MWLYQVRPCGRGRSPASPVPDTKRSSRARRASRLCPAGAGASHASPLCPPAAPSAFCPAGAALPGSTVLSSGTADRVGAQANDACCPWSVQNVHPHPMRQTTTPAPASGGGSPPSCSSAAAAANAPGLLMLFQVGTLDMGDAELIDVAVEGIGDAAHVAYLIDQSDTRSLRRRGLAPGGDLFEASASAVQGSGVARECFEGAADDAAARTGRPRRSNS